jgi:hypothetical protein
MSLSGDLEEKTPRTIDELRLAFKFLLTYFTREWTHQKERIVEKSSTLVDAKIERLKRRGCAKEGAAPHERKAYRLAIEGLEHQLHTAQRHGNNYKDAIDWLKKFQDQVGELALSDAKILTEVAKAGEKLKHKKLEHAFYSAHSNLVKKTGESIKAMKQESLEESKIMCELITKVDAAPGLREAWTRR